MLGTSCDASFIESMYQQTVDALVDEQRVFQHIKNLSKIVPKLSGNNGKKILHAAAHNKEQSYFQQIKQTRKSFTNILKSHNVSYQCFYNMLRAQAYWELLFNIDEKLVRRIQKKSLKQHTKKEKGAYYKLAEIVIENRTAQSCQIAKMIREKLDNGERFDVLYQQYSHSFSPGKNVRGVWISEHNIPHHMRPELRKADIGDIVGPIPVPWNKPARFVIVAILDKSHDGQKLVRELTSNSVETAIESVVNNAKNKVRTTGAKSVIMRVPNRYQNHKKDTQANSASSPAS